MAEIKTPKVEMWDIASITPYELNVKKHDKEQVARIVQAILKSGKFDVPIVVDKDGVIIKGHGRRLAAIELGMKKVPVICHTDMTPEQVRAARLADNRVAISDIDTDMLRVELEGLDRELLAGIFDDKELAFITADLGDFNEGAFVDDMDRVVTEQRDELDVRSGAADAKRIPVAKAFGFKDIDGKSQIHITRLMSKAEAATGLQGEEALITFAAAL